jgi:hypothetical protein
MYLNEINLQVLINGKKLLKVVLSIACLCFINTIEQSYGELRDVFQGLKNTLFLAEDLDDETLFLI